MNEKILEGALKVFREKGPKFTMDDLATEMKMSKKTIYTIFTDKNELMCEMMEYAFDLIKASEDKIYYDSNLSTVEKIRGILSVLPESHYGFEYSAMHQLAVKYPMAYQKMIDRLDGGWEKTMELLKKGMEEGHIRDINLTIFKLMYESCVDKLLMGDFLSSNEMDYPSALVEVVDIMVDGILVKDK
ncbi:MAG: TetR/AcrR family transcriptional regulator [Pseudobutyrivibrio sp.]|nr:TetR/AcrR family transcriptional regulator [Pseudobutyrivibrio sp.]